MKDILFAAAEGAFVAIGCALMVIFWTFLRLNIWG
jgi:hypothetical protein